MAMPDHRTEKPIDLGVYGHAPDARRPGLGAAEIGAAALTLVWLGLCAGIYVTSDRPVAEQGGLTALLTEAGVAMPVLLIWVAALTLRSLRLLGAEAAELREALTVLRQAQLAQQHAAGLSRRAAHDEGPLPPRPAETGPAMPPAPASPPQATAPRQPARPAAASPAPAQTTADGQTLLALGPPAEITGDPVPAAELILALNFPDDADDTAAIVALRRALQNHTMAKLIRAAQDVLTLLGRDGIFMDGFQPDRARTEVWRRFAAGERGREIAALGGIRDRETLATLAVRMRQDPVFRDAAHHFLRSFDRCCAAFAETAEDADLAAFAETRTAKAFMLIGRVSGTFD